MSLLNLQIVAGGDDAVITAHFTNPLLNTYSTNDLIIPCGHTTGGHGSQNYHSKAWHRFINVTVPKGATIASAILSIFVTNSGTAPSLISQVEDAGNSAMPTTFNDAEGRSLTTSVAWAFGGPIVANTWYTLDIVNLIQAIIDRVDWASGNSLGIKTSDNGSAADIIANIRAFDGDPTQAAKLDITYSSPDSGGSKLESILSNESIANGLAL